VGLLVVLSSCSDTDARPLPIEPVTTSTTPSSTVTIATATAVPPTTSRPAVAPAVPTRPTPRTIEIAEVSLRAGEWFALGVHPDATSVRVSVTAGDVEVCAANPDPLAGGGSPDGGARWPLHLDAARCMPVRAGAPFALPATDGNWHLFFAVRALSATNTTFTMTYVAQDSLFYYRPPELAAGAVSPLARFTGARTGDVRIYVREIGAYRASLVTSRATIVRDFSEPADDLPFGELVVDDRATLAVTNTGQTPARPALYLEWPIAAA